MIPIDNGFGYIEVKPVQIIDKRNPIIQVRSKGSCAVRAGVALIGRYKDKIVVYQAYTELEKILDGIRHTYVPVDACFALYELEDHEETQDPVWVDRNVGKDMNWYNG